MTSDTNDIERQLFDAIVSAGLSPSEIARRAGVVKSQLSLFLNGKRSLTLTSAAKIARVLGLELRSAGRKTKSRKKKPG